MFNINKVLVTRIKLVTEVSRKCSNQEVRVRFAPSPTGYLHLGGLRTALYNYFFARKHGGKFILRIEDTDQTRLVKGAGEAMQEDLKWAGIEIDEGRNFGGDYGPYVQSERVNLYKEQVHILLNNGSAYPCFCTDRRLELLRRDAARIRQVPKYDNRCRHMNPHEVRMRLESGDKHCVRFKLKPDCESFEDMIFGNIAYDVALNEGDPVIMKSDSFPTYHFANVVDDHFMNITHVLRGVEWQISTTKHILMYRAFNWEPPKYGHLPLLMNADGSKLSKRQGDVRISHYREDGIFPLALVNFITKSGGGFTKDLERGLRSQIYTLQELTEQFNTQNINAHSGKIMPERLLEFNRLELQRQLLDEESAKVLLRNVKEIINNRFAYRSKRKLQMDDEHIMSILTWAVTRISKLSDLFADDMVFLWTVPDVTTMRYQDEDIRVVRKIFDGIEEVEFNRKSLNTYLKSIALGNHTTFQNFMKLLRLILSGLKEGPSVAEMMEILGAKNTKIRLEMFLNKESKLR